MICVSNADARRIIRALKTYADTEHDGSTKAINDRRIAKQLARKLSRKNPA